MHIFAKTMQLLWAILISLVKVFSLLFGILIFLLGVMASCSAIERHYMSKEADKICNQFEIGATRNQIIAIVGQENLNDAYISKELGYRFRVWDWLGVSAEACSLWFEEDVLIRKKRHGELN